MTDTSEPPVNPADPRKGRMVIEPDDRDVETRRDEGEVRGPPSQQGVEQPSRSVVGNADVENQQRDDDGEDAVGL